MASGTGSVTNKHHHTDCCGCFGFRREKLDKTNPLSIKTPYPLERSGKNLTQKDIVDFSSLVKVDELDQKMAEQNADESLSDEEVKTIDVVFKKIHGDKEEKK
jgi:hypothetical protein